MLAKLEFNEIRLSSLFPLQAERRRYLFHIFMETEVCHTVNRVLSPLITWGTGVRLAWLRRIKRHPSGVFTAPPKSYMERQAALNMISHNSNYNKRIPSSSINIGIVIICAGGPFPRLERPPPSPSPFSLLSLSIDTHIHTATDRERERVRPDPTRYLQCSRRFVPRYCIDGAIKYSELFVLACLLAKYEWLETIKE